MSVNKPVQPSYGVDSGSTYPLNIDKEISVAKVIVDDFAPYAADTPDMTVKLAAGKIIKADGTLVEQAEQTTATITAPASNPRIDRVVIDSVTGAYSVITGAEAATPTAPSITAGKLPVAQIALATSTTQITNSLITDERTFIYRPGAPVMTKTGAYTVAVADIGALIVATTGTWTLTLPAAATAGNGFVFEFYNAGTGTITIDPNASELINGATTMGVGPGGRGRIICTGSAWYAVGNFARSALVYRSTNQSISSGVSTALNWDTDSIDTDSIHDTVSNTSRMTIPAGVKQIRITAFVQWLSSFSSTNAYIYLYRNVVETPIGVTGRASFVDRGHHVAAITTGILPVTEGDYFELAIHQDSGVSQSVSATVSWLQLEILG